MSSITNLPSSLTVKIEPSIFEKFPNAKISFLLLSVPVLLKKSQSNAEQKFLSNLKQASVQQLVDVEVTPDNYQALRVCQSWKEVFGTFQAEGKASTIENLLRRAATEGDKIRKGQKADVGSISNFVDLYNSVSRSTLTPMGATDVAKIAQDEQGQAEISLRFAKEGEGFVPLGRDAVRVDLTPTSVVYADQKAILTGFWNWRDSEHCCVPPESQKNADGSFAPEYILLVADQAEQDGGALEKPIHERPGDAEEAILRSKDLLHNIGGTWYTMDVLSASRPEVTLDLSKIKENEVTVTPMVESHS